MRFGVAFASCVILAWSLQRTLTGLAVGPPVEYSYTFTAPQGAPHNTAATAGDIWLRLLYADGRERPLRSLERSGAWEDVGFALVHRGDTQAAAVTARGKFVACFLSTRLAGIIHVDGAPGLTQDVDLFRGRDDSSLTCLDLAGGRLASRVSDRRRDAALRTLLAFVPLLVVAAPWRPWTSAARHEGWIVLHVSLLRGVVRHDGHVVARLASRRGEYGEWRMATRSWRRGVFDDRDSDLRRSAAAHRHL
jgi:hypothetical protein